MYLCNLHDINSFSVYRTKFLILRQGQEHEQTMLTEGQTDKEACTGEFLQNALGLQLCGRLSYRNTSLAADAPFFPLSGPFKAHVMLNKIDSHSGYELKAMAQVFRVSPTQNSPFDFSYV